MVYIIDKHIILEARNFYQNDYLKTSKREVMPFAAAAGAGVGAITGGAIGNQFHGDGDVSTMQSTFAPEDAAQAIDDDEYDGTGALIGAGLGAIGAGLGLNSTSSNGQFLAQRKMDLLRYRRHRDSERKHENDYKQDAMRYKADGQDNQAAVYAKASFKSKDEADRYQRNAQNFRKNDFFKR